MTNAGCIKRGSLKLQYGHVGSISQTAALIVVVAPSVIAACDESLCSLPGAFLAPTWSQKQSGVYKVNHLE